MHSNIIGIVGFIKFDEYNKSKTIEYLKIIYSYLEIVRDWPDEVSANTCLMKQYYKYLN
ncbi:hypothetical protein LOR37_06960 [Clostridium estertheticum]|uniref:hypothetical protein n=1 Tax=Clostridium estertheticum TaxID=238834 RepID=UPI0022DD611E|nr:hypothetical protein [Clostridium estertheticum]WBL48392.1 hypothetical protein LOR37_06960 [Clostridium estertheticum]